MLALPLGVAMGAYKPIEAFFEPFVSFARYLPASAFIPLLILWAGIGEAQKLAVIFIGSFFQLVLMIAVTVGNTRRDLVEAAYTLGVSDRSLIRRVLMPGAAPEIAEMLRMVLGWAWTYVIVAELIGASSGIGHMITDSQALLATDQIIFGIIVIGLIGLVSDFAFKWVNRRLFPWAQLGLWTSTSVGAPLRGCGSLALAAMRGGRVVVAVTEPMQQHRIQLHGLHRLGQEVVHAGLQTARAIVVVGVGSHRQDRRVRAAGQRADLAGGIQAVERRHLHVHQHGRVVGGRGHLHRLQSIGGNVNPQAHGLEKRLGDLAIDRVVFGQQDQRAADAAGATPPPIRCCQRAPRTAARHRGRSRAGP